MNSQTMTQFPMIKPFNRTRFSSWMILFAITIHTSSYATPLDQELVFRIDHCIEYALTHSPDFNRQKLIHLSKGLEVQREQVALDPTLALQSSRDFENKNEHQSSVGISKSWHGGWKLSSEIGNSSSSSGQDTVSKSIQLSKELLKGGSQLETKIALDNSLNTQLRQANTLSLERRRLIYLVKTSYFKILKNMETLKIQQLRLIRAQRNLEHAIERDEPMDIATAKLEVPNSDIRVLNAQINIDTALDDLKVLMGMRPERSLGLVQEWSFAFKNFQHDQDNLWALEHHEDFLNQRLIIQQNERLIHIAKKSRWPSVQLTAQLADESLDGFHNFDSQQESLGLSLSWPIGSRSSGIGLELAENLIERDRWSLKRDIYAKTKNLRRLARKLTQQKKSIELQEQQVKLRQLQVDLFNDRWNEGEIDIIELVRNQNELENSKVDLVSAKISYLQLIEEYLFEVGKEHT